jgi:hypothetical protein
MDFPGDGRDDVLAGLNGDSSVDPDLVAGELNILREATLADGWSCSGSGGLAGGGGRLPLGSAVAPEELGVCRSGGKGKARNPK